MQSLWVQLYTVLHNVVMHGLVYFFPKAIRLFVLTLKGAIGIIVAAGLAALYEPLLAMTEALTELPNDWSPFVDAYTLANAWLPVSETVLGLTIVFSFRAAHVAVKIVEKMWEAVPLN